MSSITHHNAYKSSKFYVYLRKQLPNDLGVWRVYDRKHDLVYESGTAFHEVIKMIGHQSNYTIDKEIAAILPTLVDKDRNDRLVARFSHREDTTPTETRIETLVKIALAQGWQQGFLDDIKNMEHTLTSIARICKEQGADREQTKALTDLLVAVRTGFLTMVNDTLKK